MKQDEIGRKSWSKTPRPACKGPLERNLVYEIKCVSSNNRAERKLEEECGDSHKEQREKKKEIRSYKYIGETSRFSFKRRFKHFDQLATLSNKSMLLRHILDQHQGEEFSDVKWVMKVKEFKRIAFQK